MLQSIDLRRVLFLDIETVPQEKNYNDLSVQMKILWDKKVQKLSSVSDWADKSPEELYERAGIYSEFGKIVCISCGFFSNDTFRIKSFYGDDEKAFLQEFAQLLSQYFNGRESFLCAHNGKEFDFPYIARRMLINKIKLPSILNVPGKKPWEVSFLDTMDLWRFGDYKSFTSLELLAAVFVIPTPKDDIDGSMVGKTYWEQNDLERIVTYCQKDVVTTVQVFLQYRGDELLDENQIIYSGL